MHHLYPSCLSVHMIRLRPSELHTPIYLRITPLILPSTDSSLHYMSNMADGTPKSRCVRSIFKAFDRPELYTSHTWLNRRNFENKHTCRILSTRVFIWLLQRKSQHRDVASSWKVSPQSVISDQVKLAPGPDCCRPWQLMTCRLGQYREDIQIDILQGFSPRFQRSWHCAPFPPKLRTFDILIRTALSGPRQREKNRTSAISHRARSHAGDHIFAEGRLPVALLEEATCEAC